jgi:hypothetical protein
MLTSEYRQSHASFERVAPLDAVLWSPDDDTKQARRPCRIVTAPIARSLLSSPQQANQGSLDNSIGSPRGSQTPQNNALAVTIAL